MIQTFYKSIGVVGIVLVAFATIATIIQWVLTH